MIRPLLEHLHLDIKRQEGQELICVCPWCGKPKLSVNSVTGAWRCLKECNPWAKGYPYQLVQRITQQDPKSIYETLERFGLGKDSPPPARTQQAKPSTPQIQGGYVDLPNQDLETFCKAKGIYPPAMFTLGAKRHAKDNLVLIPAWNPKNMTLPCGWIRAGLNGEPVTIHCKDDQGNTTTRQEKYPVVAGSKPGLVGLPYAAKNAPELVVWGEGWKDAVAATAKGFVGVAGSQGALTWRDEWRMVFKLKAVWICFDRDKAGVDGAQKAARNIYDVAKEVRIVELPYEYTETHGKDLHDYLMVDGHTREDLEALAAAAPVYEPPRFPTETRTDSDGRTILPDNDPRTAAEAFRQAQAKRGIEYRYHIMDKWTRFEDGFYKQIDPEVNLFSDLSDFMYTCWFYKGKNLTRLSTAKSRVNDVMAQLRAIKGHVLLPDEKGAPCSLTGDLDIRHTIGLQNGLLDWRTYPHVLRPLTKDFYTVNYLPFEWKGDIDSDMWIKYLIDATGGDEELHDLLQQWAGYCLMPHDRTEQKFVIVYGQSGTGKTVFLDVLTHMLGEDNVSHIPLELFADPKYSISTYGKMLNATDESTSHLEENIEKHLKGYTGGGRYNFRRLYHESFPAYPTAKIMIATNHLPAFRDTSNAVWRRLIIIPFDYVVPEDKRIKGLQDRIITTELPGVLKWALDGARKLQKYGFYVPDQCHALVEQHRRESVPEIAFFEENLEACDTEDGVRCDAVRAAYERWCKGQGVMPKSQRKLNLTMEDLFPLHDRKRGRSGGQLTYLYYGIRFQTDSEYAERSGPVW